MSASAAPELPSSYFTFGYDHAHSIDGRTYDRDVVVCVTSPDPRATMLDMFGRKWSTEHVAPGPVPRTFGPTTLVDVVEVDGERVVVWPA
jgi:hypothetical protein